MRKNFLLLNKTAVKLYKSVKNLPVIDYHNHLSIEDIEKDTEYKDIYKLWVKPDPYKHRVMRMCGVPEKYITGEAEDFEKFSKWCETVPKLTGHPLQHWTMMELELFKVYEMPCKENAEKIYRKCNEFLKKNKLSPSTFFKKFNVEKVCPCMTVTDRIFSSEICVPSLRGDGIADTVKSFGEINSLDDFERALKNRINEFKKSGCRVADHALDNGFSYYKDDGKNNERFLSLLNETITEEDKKKLSSYLLTFMGRQYAKNGFIMQLHIGAQRETSSYLRSAAGKEGGFAAMGNSVNVKSLIEFLEALDESCGLPKTILFTLNPADNALISTISGSFAKDNAKGLITQGPAWWWCDHKQGMVEMLENNSVYGLLSNFIGMTTDSRSFLSFVRHDYFRRILCTFLGEKVEKGEYLCDYKNLERLAKDICYYNAKNAMEGNYEI